MTLTAMLLVVGILQISSLNSEMAVAAENGPGYYNPAPNYPFLGAYKTAGGNFVYCTEHLAPPPYSNLPSSKRVTSLPAATFENPVYGKGTVKALTSAKKMRQLNYMLDVHGRSANNLTAAGLEVAIWILRDDPFVSNLKKSLKSTTVGKNILAKADSLLVEASKNAVAPKEAPEMKSKIKIEVNTNKKGGTVTFPAGTTTLQLSKGNKFKASSSEVIQLTAKQTRDGGTRDFTTKDSNPKKAYSVSVTGKWRTEGVKGWPAELIQHVNVKPREQAVVRAVSPTTPKAKTGSFKATAEVTPNPKILAVTTLAQETAKISDKMTDTATITGDLKAGSKYEIEFEAYLLPEAGSPKFNTSWQQNGSQVWLEKELSDKTTAEKAALQRVARTTKQTVTKTGKVTSPAVTVRSYGTIYWSERFYEEGKLIHTGKLGLANERTKISRTKVKVVTNAQPDAEVGATMIDHATVTGDIVSDSEIDFTAYLVPVVGSIKYDSNWNPIMGEPYEEQMEDPETGLPLFDQWWADENGEPLLDEENNRIPTSSASGVAANQVAYPIPVTEIISQLVMVNILDENGEPVVLLDEEGEPQLDSDGFPLYETEQATTAEGEPIFEEIEVNVLDYDGNPTYFVAQTPVMQIRSDAQTWSADELESKTTAERAALQPVAVTSKQSVPATVGANLQIKSSAITVKSAGTIYWSERFYENGEVVHTGKIGLSNEKTVVGMPAVRTKAQTNASVGETITDTAIVTGKLSEHAEYSIKFEAFKAEYSEEGVAVCLPENEIFQSAKQKVNKLGNIVSPGFTVRHEHGQTIWWVETLSELRDGLDLVLHRGECGLANETTTISIPKVSTQSVEEAAVGDLIHDVAIVTGDFQSNSNAEYEVSFQGFSETWRTESGEIVAGNKTSSDDTPVCTFDNQLFQTGATTVTGPGEYVSEKVVVSHLFRTDTVWWVESLWLLEGEKRTLLHEGACGLPNESTHVLRPEISSQAIEFATPGDLMHDIAYVDGHLAQNDRTQYEVTFQAFSELWKLPDGSLMEGLETENIEDTEAASYQPVCDASQNLIAETNPINVDGKGEYLSEEIPVLTEHEGLVWWIETLWMMTDDKRIPVATGECGLFNETTEVELPKVTTKAVEKVFMGEELYDTAIVEGPLSEREEISHTIGFEAFKAQTDTDGNPVCEDSNRLFGTPEVAIDGTGEYESERRVASPSDIGTIWWVESLFMYEDQKESVILHRGECGLPNETTIVQGPLVTTTAVDQAVVGEGIYDTAHVTAPISTETGSVHELNFKAYLQPLTETIPVCEIENMIFDESIEIDRPGDHSSPKLTTTVDHVGKIYWVETLTLIKADSEMLLAEGECGLPNETTIVTVPKVETEAVQKAMTGEPIFDLAHVSGDLPTQEGVSYSLSFEAFHAEAETNYYEEACTPDRLVWESTQKIPVIEPGTYKSETWRPASKNAGQILWVETLWVTTNGGNTTESHRGECGAVNEITLVSDPEDPPTIDSPPVKEPPAETPPVETPPTTNPPLLVETGGQGVRILLITGALLTALGLVLALTSKRRRMTDEEA